MENNHLKTTLLNIVLSYFETSLLLTFCEERIDQNSKREANSNSSAPSPLNKPPCYPDSVKVDTFQGSPPPLTVQLLPLDTHRNGCAWTSRSTDRKRQKGLATVIAFVSAHKCQKHLEDGNEKANRGTNNQN